MHRPFREVGSFHEHEDDTKKPPAFPFYGKIIIGIYLLYQMPSFLRSWQESTNPYKFTETTDTIAKELAKTCDCFLYTKKAHTPLLRSVSDIDNDHARWAEWNTLYLLEQLLKGAEKDSAIHLSTMNGDQKGKWLSYSLSAHGVQKHIHGIVLKTTLSPQTFSAFAQEWWLSKEVSMACFAGLYNLVIHEYIEQKQAENASVVRLTDSWYNQNDLQGNVYGTRRWMNKWLQAHILWQTPSVEQEHSLAVSPLLSWTTRHQFLDTLQKKYGPWDAKWYLENIATSHKFSLSREKSDASFSLSHP